MRNYIKVFRYYVSTLIFLTGIVQSYAQHEVRAKVIDEEGNPEEYANSQFIKGKRVEFSSLQ